jgi:two-component system NarL family response regulator
MNRIRVILVEDHRMVREALRDALAKVPDVQVVGEAGDAASALEQTRLLSPDVVVLDIGLPDLNGMEVAARLRDADSHVRIVVLSAYSDKRFVAEMLRSGASAYVTKSAAATELVLAIRAVVAGKGYFSAEIAGALATAAHDRPSSDAAPRLARREREVLRLIADGVRSPQIAERLHIALGTVEAHRRNIMRKLGLRTVAELTKHAIREGIVSL